MANTDFDAQRIAIMRSTLAAAGIPSVEESTTSFDVVLSDNTRIAVGSAHGVITVGRVMPSGNVTGQAVFTNIPTSLVGAAIQAMVVEAGL